MLSIITRIKGKKTKNLQKPGRFKPCLPPFANVILHILAPQSILFPLPSEPFDPVFVTAKTREKARRLLDPCTLNAHWPTPPRFPLPTLSRILDTPRAHTLFFPKLDVPNFFWSLRLPCTVQGCFCSVRRGPHLRAAASTLRLVLVSSSRAAHARLRF